jgi:putative ATP-dependent endonuclease of OLD family
MYIHKIDIKNFRLLTSVDLFLEERTTVIVGRNNSGKTSLTELFRRLLTDNTPSFRFEDFSLSAHENFWKAFLLKREGRTEDEIREALPIIEVRLTIDYGKNESDLGLLSEFIIDLNPSCSEALIILRYQLKDGAIGTFFENIPVDEQTSEEEQKTVFCRAIRDRVPEHYISIVLAEDPGDSTNQKPVEFSKLRGLILSGFISAQRGLDDTTHKDINLLGKVLENLLTSATADSADTQERDIAQNLEKAIDEIQSGIDGGFNKQLQDLLPAFTLFGYPGLSDPRLLTETTLDVERLLKNHTRVHYAGVNGINLPEAYNGLGVRNLVFILLKLYEFFKSFKSKEGAPGIHLIFIEEPEVHLHPQMQEVFIGKLGEIANVFANKFNGSKPWPVQFVVTTHSSHVANRADFEAMRYFFVRSDGQSRSVRSTDIKDLRKGLGGTPKEDKEFLHKYMTLTRCDLLFADKAVLIEGTAERLLLPKMIEKGDAGRPDGQKLSSQYVSVVEVGGAYAHIFFDLLNFLELRTLVITDLDTVDKNNAGKSCKVSAGTHTSNQCIMQWLGDPNITPSALIAKSAEDKTNTIRRLAYQVPETAGAPCGRSFEDAFILANMDLFALGQVPQSEREAKAWTEAERVSKKSDFALEYAITKTTWVVPKYIAEGLQWLAEGVRPPTPTPLPQTAKPKAAAGTPPREKKSDV